MERDLSVLNDGFTAYLHPGCSSQSAIDLTICDPLLYLDLSWRVHHDLCGSDHFPIAIYCNRVSTFETNCSWKLSKANWKAFSDKAAPDLKYESVRDPDDLVGNFTNILINVANDIFQKANLNSLNTKLSGLTMSAKKLEKHGEKHLKELKLPQHPQL